MELGACGTQGGNAGLQVTNPGAGELGLQRGLPRPTSVSPGHVAVCGGSSTLGGW